MNLATQERSFLVNTFDKLAVNMTSYSEVEEEVDEEDDRQENSLGEIYETLAALEAIPMRITCGQIFSLRDEAHQHMATTLKHPELFVDKSN